MPKDVNEFIQEKWNDDKLRDTFFKKKFKDMISEDGINWVGKDQGKPHPDFIRWLGSNEI